MAKPALALLLLLLAAVACNDDAGSGDRWLYLALGDSLSEGVGASDPNGTGFVPLVHDSLDGFELMNLGHSGDTSTDLIEHGHLDRAIEEIEGRNGDENAANDVRLVTLEIGGNDLLRIYFSLVQTRVCPDVATALEKKECVDALRSALDGFDPNLETALDRLHEADAALPIVLLTLYNPFGHLPEGKLGALSLEGRPDTPFPEGLNDIIRSVAKGRDSLSVVDLYPLFEGRSEDLIAGDVIHPNDAGYEVMADAVIAATRGLNRGN